MKKQKKCYIYTCVSTAIQVDGYSLVAQYDKSETIDAQIEEWNSRLLSVRQEKISADNVYQLLMRAFIERIDIYPEKPDNDCWIRNIVFNFPMPVKGKEIKTLPLESQSTVETVCLLSKNNVEHYIEVELNLDESK